MTKKNSSISPFILIGIFCLGIAIGIIIGIKVKTSCDVNPTVNKIANPASENCINSGGKLEIKKDGIGGEYGLCYFEDNMACEEWALYRKECPIGGVKTTGFDTEAQRFCAWMGGKTLAVENAVCTLTDGSSCYAEDLFNRKCLNGGMSIID